MRVDLTTAIRTKHRLGLANSPAHKRCLKQDADDPQGANTSAYGTEEVGRIDSVHRLYARLSSKSPRFPAHAVLADRQADWTIKAPSLEIRLSPLYSLPFIRFARLCSTAAFDI